MTIQVHYPLQKGSIMTIKSRWFARPTSRPDAGNLFNAFRLVNGVEVECDRTPTHSEAEAKRIAAELNGDISDAVRAGWWIP